MTQPKNGDTVKVHYTGKLEDGTVFDSSRERDQPLEFTLGQGMVIPGFEKAVAGMAVGDQKEVTLEVDEAYGPHNESLVVEVSKDNL
ncbi:MAG: FKBP-type peptidyl-prolyl cis-trans isomerase, partial [Calditrichaeota bacterium]|nr:FKBP-type peptidyl-prolyl cis-trans isomerase [Calditrichota bacterium]